MKLIRLASAASIAAVAACATAPQSEPPKIETVYVPIAQEAKRVLPPEPAWAMDALPIGAPIDEQVKALTAERRQRKAYQVELFGACK